ncbi:MAG: helicase-related protein, partial [Acinetobacter sp.]
HIPNVNSGEAHIDKGMAVDAIISCLGEEIGRDEKTGIITIKTKAGRIIKMADLVDDNKIMRPKTQAYLRAIKKPEEMDIIVALGMAKEGFDWIYCEHVLTIGFRNSMTEVVQIIGRATRDCEGKTHAQFTNLIAMPDAKSEDVRNSVNNLLKAITLSLLMEQVMAPNVQFKRRSDLKQDEMILPGTVIIDDRTVPVNKKLVDILNQDADSIIAQLAEKPEVKQVITASANPEILGQLALPEILVSRYPDLSVEERDQLQQGILTRFTITQHGGLIQGKDIPADAVIEGERTFTQIEGKWVAIDTLSAEQFQALSAEVLVRERDLPADAAVVGASTGTPAGGAGNDPDQFGNKQFIKMGNKFIDVVNLPIDLIKSVNPFERAYEILSKNVTTDVLKTIQNV